jgi:hypothetical protein
MGMKLATGDSSMEETGAAAGIGRGTVAGFATGAGTATGAATGDVSSSLSFANGSLNVLFTAAILCRIS